MKVDEFVKLMRDFERDHVPDGWPAIQMWDVSKLCSIIERQREFIKMVEKSAYYADGQYLSDQAREALDMEG